MAVIVGDGVQNTYGANGVFSNSHVDTNINPSTDFVTSNRCLIYARPSAMDTGTTTPSDQFYRCGVIQSYSFTEQKDVARIFELGSEVPYLIPQRTIGSLSLSRIMLFGADLVNILYYNSENPTTNSALYENTVASITADDTNDSIIRSIDQITKPIDMLFCYFKNGDVKSETSAKYTRLFTQCHIVSRSEQVDANNIIIGENVAIYYAKMGPVQLNG